jgi:hypothetical protein
MIRGVAAFLATLALAPAPAFAAGTGQFVPEQVLVNPPGEVVITPVQARSLVRAVWQARAGAFAIGNLDWIRNLETGAAAEFDAGADHLR